MVCALLILTLSLPARAISNIAVADPTALEERCAEAQLVFGLNSYRELCGLHFGGVTMASSQLLLKCATRGANHARTVVQLVKAELQRDAEQRAAGGAASFTECVRLNRITSLAQDRLAIRLKRFRMVADGEDDRMDEEDEAEDEGQNDGGDGLADDSVVIALDAKSAALVPQTPKWVPESDFENSEDDDAESGDDADVRMIGAEVTAEVPEAKTTKPKAKSAPVAHSKPKKGKAKVKENSDSEEEATVVMETVE